jgi:aryl-alcohol dehydrogenase-like predicted oxidoreductase
MTRVSSTRPAVESGSFEIGDLSVAHLEQNVGAADVQLSDDQFAALDKAL